MAAQRARDPELGDIEGFVRAIVSDCQLGGPVAPTLGRPAILPALALWSGLLICLIRGFSSQRDLWRLLQSGRFWDFPRYAISDQAVYHRLARDGTAPLEALFAQVSRVVAERLEAWVDDDLAPFASQVVALDETTLDPVARTLPVLRGVPTEQAIPGKLAGLFDIRRQQWQRIHFHPDFRQNEKVLARDVIADLPESSLILCDLGYFAFEWFDDLTTAGHWWISRLRAKTSYRISHVFYQDGQVLDALIWLGAYRADRARYLVRLVQIPYGRQVRRYITNVTAPEDLSIQEIARIYARRWDIEMAVQLVKQQLGLGLLWSAKPVVI